jgi:hypothetical protein
MKLNNSKNYNLNKILVFTLVVNLFWLFSCGSKPTICECHEAFLENAESAMGGDASVSDEVAECSKHYSTEEMLYADENNGC